MPRNVCPMDQDVDRKQGETGNFHWYVTSETEADLRWAGPKDQSTALPPSGKEKLRRTGKTEQHNGGFRKDPSPRGERNDTRQKQSEER